MSLFKVTKVVRMFACICVLVASTVSQAQHTEGSIERVFNRDTTELPVLQNGLAWQLLKDGHRFADPSLYQVVSTKGLKNKVVIAPNLSELPAVPERFKWVKVGGSKNKYKLVEAPIIMINKFYVDSLAGTFNALNKPDASDNVKQILVFLRRAMKFSINDSLRLLGLNSESANRLSSALTEQRFFDSDINVLDIEIAKVLKLYNISYSEADVKFSNFNNSSQPNYGLEAKGFKAVDMMADLIAARHTYIASFEYSTGNESSLTSSLQRILPRLLSNSLRRAGYSNIDAKKVAASILKSSDTETASASIRASDNWQWEQKGQVLRISEESSREKVKKIRKTKSTTISLCSKALDG